MTSITELMKIQLKNDASDLLLKANTPPTFRINGDLVTMEAPPLGARLLDLDVQRANHQGRVKAQIH